MEIFCLARATIVSGKMHFSAAAARSTSNIFKILRNVRFADLQCFYLVVCFSFVFFYLQLGKNLRLGFAIDD